MAVGTARRDSVFVRIGGKSVPARIGGKPSPRNQVCIYWLEGRCNRNPCRYLHSEVVPSETQLQKPRKRIWRNPNSDVSKKSFNSIKEVVSNTTSNTKKKGFVESDQPKIVTVVRDVEAKSTAPKPQPKQCKYWVTGNCVHGEKCKDLHSWFCGSGFTMLGKLEGHGKAITGISLPSGDDKMYSSSKDGEVRVWNCKTGQNVGSAIIGGDVGCLVAEGPWLFAGSKNIVKAWNLQNQTEFTLSGAAGSVCSIVVDEDKVFAGTEDGTIMVWKWNPETNSLEPAAMLKGHEGGVCSLVVGAGRLYSGSRNCTIKAWDLQNLQCLQTLYGHTRDVTSVICWDSFLISASLDKSLKVWSATETGTVEVVHEIKEDHELITLCGIHDAEAKPILLCSFSDSTVRLYDLPSFEERGRIFSKREVEAIQIGVNGLFSPEMQPERFQSGHCLGSHRSLSLLFYFDSFVKS